MRQMNRDGEEREIGHLGEDGWTEIQVKICTNKECGEHRVGRKAPPYLN